MSFSPPIIQALLILGSAGFIATLTKDTRETPPYIIRGGSSASIVNGELIR